MGVSYSVKDETIDRLVERNRELRDELDFMKKAAKAKDENNAKLANKIAELNRENMNLNAEIDSCRACIQTLVGCMSGLANKLHDEADRVTSIAEAVKSAYLGKCS